MGDLGETVAIIAAAGRGLRAGGETAKQWQELGGRRVADRALAAFREAPGVDGILLLLGEHEMQRAADYPDVMAVAGGKTRTASVRAGLEALSEQQVARVLIHDAARPLVSQQTISNVIAALDYAEGAAPALEITDALWRGERGVVTGAQDRSGLYRAQTPQGFHFKAILNAHRRFSGDAADDVAVATAAGLEIAIVPGDEHNLKLTREEDFARADAILGGKMDIRVGNGFDVHAFKPGRRIMLCGVEIPHGRALKGHSDADVGLHAITDAIYGALAEGDIGRHFPPDDKRWKNAESRIFLQHAISLAREKGYRITSIDVTLICERPKISPYAADMKKKLSEISDIDAMRVSIKATTSEGLGFTGREEGIAAQATATLVKP